MREHAFALALICTLFAVGGALSSDTCVVSKPYSVVASSYLPDCTALWDLYVATNGPTWTETSWSDAGNSSIQTACCTSGLAGIQCDSLTGRVVAVSLTGFGLRGFIPESVGNLSEVQLFFLTSNTLTGTIPASFGGLSQLRKFDLSNNQLSGSIPPSFGNLSQLRLFGVVVNQLSGQIPLSFCQLGQLSALGLALNQLSGSIPECLGQLSQLRQLTMYSNQFTGQIPPSLGNLTLMAHLDLAWNQLDGEIPASLGNLANLETLQLYANRLTGAIPASLGKLSNLKELKLSSNKLTGSIPYSLGSLSQLETFFAETNQLSGSIPDSLGNLSSLIELSLRSNELSGSIPASMGKLSQLTNLILDFNRFSGPIPESFSNLLQLSSLRVSMNQLNGTIPHSFGNLSRLQRFDASSNALTGEIPSSLGKLTELRYLFLSSNQLTGPIPDTFGNLTMMIDLGLSQNQLTGEIPQSMAPLAQMKLLDLRSNRFEGRIPSFICTWAELKFLYLSSNQFSHFPDCALPSAVQLELASNRLRTFPFTLIANFSSLLALDLSNNNFTGDFPLPLFIGGISLRSLSLANNHFEGPFPIYACNVLTENGIVDVDRSSGLSELDLSGNIITSIPGTRDYSICSTCSTAYYSLTALRVSAAALPPSFPESSYTFDEYGQSLCLAPAAPFTRMLEFLPGLRYLYLSENNLSIGLDAIFDVLPLLNLVDLRNNPHAEISSSLSPSNQRIFSFDASSAYPFSTSISCFVSTVGSDARLTVYADPNFFDYSNCVCRPGYYGKPPNCRPCISSHAQCSFPTDSDINSVDISRAWNLSGNIIANEGYWASPPVPLEEMQSNRNYPAAVELCTHAGTDLTPCKPTGGQPCATGYIGRQCSACVKGYFRIGERCSSCPSGAPRVLFAILLASVFTAIILWSFFVGSAAGGLVKVIVFFFQALFFIRVPMPSALYSITLSTSSSAMAVLAGPECFFSDWDYAAAYLLAVCAPIGSAVLVAIVFAVGYWAFGQRQRSWLDRCLRSILFLMLLLYTSAINALLTPLACQQDAGDGREYMVALPSETCSSQLRFWSAILLVIYVVVVPIAFAFVVSKSGVLSDTESTTGGPQFVFSLVYATYRPGARAWEFVVTVRRFFLVAAFVCVSSGSALRTVFAGSVLSFSLCLQAVFAPYTDRLANQMESCSMALLLLNLAVAAHAQALGISDVDVVGIVICILNGSFTLFVTYKLLKDSTKTFLSWIVRRLSRQTQGKEELEASLLDLSKTDGL